MRTMWAVIHGDGTVDALFRDSTYACEHARRWNETIRPAVRSVLISEEFEDAPWAEWCRVWGLVGAMAAAEWAGDRETERRRGGGL